MIKIYYVKSEIEEWKIIINEAITMKDLNSLDSSF